MISFGKIWTYRRNKGSQNLENSELNEKTKGIMQTFGGQYFLIRKCVY